MKFRLTVITAVVLCVVARPVPAQFAVIDPANLVQNILAVTHALTQIENQVAQLQNEAQMLIHEELNLAALDFSTLERLRAALDVTGQLIAEADGLAFEVGRVQQQFGALYPHEYAATVSRAQMWAEVRERWQRSRDALVTSVSVQAQAVTNFAVDEGVLVDLIDRSQAAVGALQAMQATNQLLALQARQAIQAQQLDIVQDRAAALEQARVVAAQTRAREVRRRFQGEGLRYTPQPVQF